MTELIYEFNNQKRNCRNNINILPYSFTTNISPGQVYLKLFTLNPSMVTHANSISTGEAETRRLWQVQDQPGLQHSETLSQTITINKQINKNISAPFSIHKQLLPQLIRCFSRQNG